MTLKPIKDSEAIEAVGYDAATKTMHVKFTSGHTYEYKGVPAATHAAFIGADSKGSHFHAHIRPKHIGKKISKK